MEGGRVIVGKKGGKEGKDGWETIARSRAKRRARRKNKNKKPKDLVGRMGSSVSRTVYWERMS